MMENEGGMREVSQLEVTISFLQWTCFMLGSLGVILITLSLYKLVGNDSDYAALAAGGTGLLLLALGICVIFLRPRKKKFLSEQKEKQ